MTQATKRCESGDDRVADVEDLSAELRAEREKERADRRGGEH
jgi:hypothetical protein